MGKPPKDKRDVIEIIAFILEFLIPVAVACIALFVEDSKIPVDGKIASLAIGLGASIVLLQFTVKFNYDAQKENSAVRDTNLYKHIESLHSEIELGEVYKDLLSVDDKLKPFLKATLESNINILKKYMADQRTGALELSVYYSQLTLSANTIIEDKQRRRGNYAGEIWALSCFLDDEWIDNGFEGAWMDKMFEADKKGVPTRRLYIFPSEKLNLLRTGTDRQEVESFLTDLKPYCNNGTDVSQFQYTRSFAIEKSAFPEASLSLLGKGFFGTKLSSGDLTLIRDVSIDNLSSNSLGGEVDFNEEKKELTRRQWELVVNAATPLDDFLCGAKVNPSLLAKDVLRGLNILS